MRYDKFYMCPYCGAALDPGEKCDCKNEKERKDEKAMEENNQNINQISQMTDQSSEEKLTMTEQFARALTDVLDGVATVEPTMAYKVNKTGQELSIQYPGEAFSIIIHPDDIIKQMVPGESVEMAAMTTAEMLQRTRDNAPTMSDLDLSPEGAKKNLVCVVMNEAENMELLKEIPHRQICGDLVMAARYRLSEYSFIVKNDLCKIFNMTGEEILEQGMKNTNQRGFKVQRIEEVIKEMMENHGMEPEFIDDVLADIQKIPIFVVTNDICEEGATAIASKEAMEKVHDTIGEDFYIIPSSRHEILVVPESMVTDPKVLKAMVEEVNATEVSREDKLSDNIYHYTATKGVQKYE